SDTSVWHYRDLRRASYRGTGLPRSPMSQGCEACHSAAYAPQSQARARRAQSGSAQTKANHDDIPERPAIVPERKIEAVKPMIKPPLDALAAGEQPDHPAHFRVHVDPGRLQVGELDPQN